MAYESENYTWIIKNFQNFLKIWPQCPTFVQFGLGLCFFRIEDYSAASKCFQRTLSLDNHHVDSLIALAMIDIQSGDETIMNNALIKLRAAYNMDKTNPVVLNYLANHFFFKNEYPKVISDDCF